ncbi:twin-arginine translocase TatA/TatE family subunit, partial [Alphaproteobacteria bacterium]|nr:twin-arginine translocase TatA/TatE family subunit [Alphaproteobacteria bacterium]
MLDFGWAELLVIMAVAVLVIGPKELPVVMRGFG